MNSVKGNGSAGVIFLGKNEDFGFAFMILLGAASALFSIKHGALELFGSADLSYIFPAFTAVLFAFMSACGFSVIGTPIVFALDFFIGAVLTPLAYVYLAYVTALTDWLLWALILFFFTLSALFISLSSCMLSKLLIDRVRADRKLKRRLAGHFMLTAALILVIASVFFLVYRLKTELLI